MVDSPHSALADERFERIRKYYACFNERRFADAVLLFTEDAVVEQVPFQRRERGGGAYMLFADVWTRAFPDAHVRIDGVIGRPGGACEVELFATGTHTGDLSMGGCVFKPTGAKATLRLRELLEFRGELIASACLSFDLQELADQLARVDETQLLLHLSRLRALEDQLRAAPNGTTQRRELIERIGREIDAARRVIRPYFAR